jgi:hypothetical protein
MFLIQWIIDIFTLYITALFYLSMTAIGLVIFSFIGMLLISIIGNKLCNYDSTKGGTGWKPMIFHIFGL